MCFRFSLFICADCRGLLETKGEGEAPGSEKSASEASSVYHPAAAPGDAPGPAPLNAPIGAPSGALRQAREIHSDIAPAPAPSPAHKQSHVVVQTLGERGAIQEAEVKPASKLSNAEEDVHISDLEDIDKLSDDYWLLEVEDVPEGLEVIGWNG